MNSTPAVSVLMPVYNAEGYVAEAVESVLAQTFSDFEFLIVDDGSSDASLTVLRKYAAREPRIRLTSRPNRGLVATLNELLAQARGEFVARMDADDFSLPERFDKQIRLFQEYPDVVCIGTAVELMDADGDRLCPLSVPTSHEEIDAALLDGWSGAIIHATTIARRSATTRVGGYYDQYPAAEDLDFYLRLAEIGRLQNLGEVLYRYRRHPGATGHIHYWKQEVSKGHAIEDARRRRGLALSARPPVGQVAGPPPPTIADQHRQCAWWALDAGQARTARKHARAALRYSPFSKASWKAMACAMRGW